MKRLLIIFALALPLLCTGCSLNGDSTTRINQVLMNPHLTPAQKNAEVKKIKAGDESPLSAPWIPSALIVVVGVVILVIAVVARGSRAPVERPTIAPVPFSQDVLSTSHAADGSSGVPMTPAERLAAARAGAAAGLAAPGAASAPVALEAEDVGGQVAEALPVLDPLPSTQEQVRAIPLNRRGISFFTSRPLSLDDLVEAPIVIGGQVRSVYTTPKEAANIQLGDVPAVRSFTVEGRTVPWYKCTRYDPYANFWEVVGQGFVVLDEECPSTWMALGALTPDIEDYTSRIATGNELAEPEPSAPEPMPVVEAIVEAQPEVEVEPVADATVDSADVIGSDAADDVDDTPADPPIDAPAKNRKNTDRIGPKA